MREKTFVVRIFDGENTTIYTTKSTNSITAENNILRYHKAFGGTVVKVTTTQQRG